MLGRKTIYYLKCEYFITSRIQFVSHADAHKVQVRCGSYLVVVRISSIWQCTATPSRCFSFSFFSFFPRAFFFLGAPLRIGYYLTLCREPKIYERLHFVRVSMVHRKCQRSFSRTMRGKRQIRKIAALWVIWNDDVNTFLFFFSFAGTYVAVMCWIHDKR